MKLLLMGPQGCGKGTQAEKLSSYYRLPIISVGQTLRSVPETNPYYPLIKSAQDSGQLVEQKLVSSLLKDLTSKSEYAQGYILDGWSRTLLDLVYFNPGFDAVIHIFIDHAETLKRLSSRRTCEKCGKVFNIFSKKPQKDDVCDFCQGSLIQRSDDLPAAIETRLAIYEKETRPVLDYFRKEGLLLEVSGDASIEAVYQEIVVKLDKKLAHVTSLV